MIRAVVDTNVLISGLFWEADYIVSGDKDILALKVFDKNIKIVSPAEFLAILNKVSIPQVYK